MRALTRILGWLYAQSLKLYPSGFRDEFGKEMTAVFNEALSDAQQWGWLSLLIWCGREFASLLTLLIQEQWLSFRREEAIMNQILNVNHVDDADDTGARSPISWTEIMAGILPFILFGLLYTLKGINYHQPWMRRGIPWELALHLFLLVGLGVGWALRFPRWAYAYLGVTLMFSAFLADTVTPGLRLFGYTFGRELWGWRAWMPLLALIVLMLLLTRSLRPLRQLFVGMWQDWTRLSFALYAALTWLFMGVAYDGKTWYNQTLYLPLNLFLLTLVITGGAFFYLRGRRQWKRVLALPAAFILHVPISTLVTTLAGYSGSSLTAVGRLILPLVWLVWASVPLWPGFASHMWRRFRPI